eukprot:Hpha_TRINITY_DN3504_c0_g2::TRINITY_DN3504_c0_g2_i1::g.25734::m.25734
MPLVILLLSQACDVAEMTAGGPFTCARNTANEVRCWGDNARGNLGTGDNAARGDTPATCGTGMPAIDFGTGVVMEKLSGGNEHICGIVAAPGGVQGEVRCWGYGYYGQLGDGARTQLGDGPGEMTALPAIPLPGVCIVS